jgi:hypothetical protein
MSAELHVVEGERSQVHEPRFKLVPFDQVRPGLEPAYLVKRLIPRVGLVVVWGPPKSGKSFWIFDLMMHVALDWRYRKRAVRGGAVVYCAFEGADGIARRIEAFRMRKLAEQSDGVPLYLVATRLDLAKQHQELIRAIRMQLPNQRPVAVVLDTLNRSLGGSESSDVDMAAYISAADAIRDAFDCAVIVVHHCGHDASRPRGHTSLPGALDAQLAVKRDGANNIVVTVEMMKDGPEGETDFSRLESVDIGMDGDGEAITSCIVVDVEGAHVVERTGKKKKTGATLTAFHALEQAIAERGTLVEGSSYIPASARVVSIDDWRAYAYARGISTSREARALQLAFKRAFDKLVADGDVAVWNDNVWIPSPDSFSVIGES